MAHRPPTFPFCSNDLSRSRQTTKVVTTNLLMLQRLHRHAAVSERAARAQRHGDKNALRYFFISSTRGFGALGVCIDAVRTLGDVGGADRDQLFSFDTQGAFFEHFGVKLQERFEQVRSQIPQLAQALSVIRWLVMVAHSDS